VKNIKTLPPVLSYISNSSHYKAGFIFCIINKVICNNTSFTLNDQSTTRKKVELKESDLCLLDNNNILQAVYYYYNMTLSYGPMFLGWPSSVEIKKDKFDRKIKKLEKFNLKNISVECCDFEEVIVRHKNDFIFLDPPYYLEGDSKMFKGMYPNCNFAIHHNNFNHDKMCELLKQHKGGFIITIIIVRL
jgi:DNA adenine methylase